MSSAPASQAYKLTHDGRELWLSEGRFNIGRSILCNLVIDDVGASRHHALLVVCDAGITIEDLGSANGTFVNGRRIERVFPLAVGDVIAIGALQITVGMGTPPEKVRASNAPKPFEGDTARHTLAAPSSSSRTEVPSAANTERRDTFALLGAVADRAFDGGNPADAARVLEPHLARVLSEARAGRALADEHLDWSVHYSLRLAAATGQARWIDYAVSLMETMGAPPRTDALVDELDRAVAIVAAADADRVQAYVEALRERAATFDVATLQRARRAEAILVRVGRKTA